MLSFFLTLLDSTFFFSPHSSIVTFPSGTFMTEVILPSNLLSPLFYSIIVNEIQQSLLYDSVVSTDVGCTIALNIQCGSLPFTLGKVISVSEEEVTVSIYTNYNSDLDSVWSLSESLLKTYSKRYTIRKHIGFTSTNLLKSTDKKFLKQKFNL